MANNIIVPNVFASAINDKLGTTLKMAPLCYDASPMVPEIKNYGDKVTFPVFNRVATVQNVVKGTPISPANVDMKSTEAEIQQVASSVRVYDVERAQIKTDALMDMMTTQITDAFARHIDSVLLEECFTNAIYSTTLTAANTVTFEELLTAMDAFSDLRDTDSFAGIVTGSKIFNSLLGMEQFVSVAETFNTGAGRSNGLVVNGLVGYILGVPVYISNQTMDATSGNSRILILKKNSCGYIFQKNVTVEVEREGKLLADDVIASALFAVKATDLEGISVLV